MLTADPIDGLRAQIWLIGTLAGKGWTEAAWIAGTLPCCCRCWPGPAGR